jgi:hypothetical protein
MPCDPFFESPCPVPETTHVRVRFGAQRSVAKDSVGHQSTLPPWLSTQASRLDALVPLHISRSGHSVHYGRRSVRVQFLIMISFSTELSP